MIEVWRILPTWFNYAAIAPLPGLVLVRRDVVPTNALLRHERIHHAQQRELAVVGFWLLYLIEFVIRFIALGSWGRAYRAISFEREAEYWELHGEGGHRRPAWNWVNYI